MPHLPRPILSALMSPRESLFIPAIIKLLPWTCAPPLLPKLPKTYLWDLNDTKKAIGRITAYVNVMPGVGGNPLDPVTDIQGALAGGSGEVSTAVAAYEVGGAGGAVDGLCEGLCGWGSRGLGLCWEHRSIA
jgi:hypothetical protein